MASLNETLKLANTLFKKYNYSFDNVNIIVKDIDRRAYSDNAGNIIISRNFLNKYNNYEVLFTLIHEWLHYILLSEIIEDEEFKSDFNENILKLAVEFEINQIAYKLLVSEKYDRYLSSDFLNSIYFPNRYNLPFNKRWKDYYNMMESKKWKKKK